MKSSITTNDGIIYCFTGSKKKNFVCFWGIWLIASEEEAATKN